MKILTNYILSTFMKVFAFVLPVFIGLYLVVEFVERIDDFKGAGFLPFNTVWINRIHNRDGIVFANFSHKT